MSRLMVASWAWGAGQPWPEQKGRGGTALTGRGAVGAIPLLMQYYDADHDDHHHNQSDSVCGHDCEDNEVDW